MIASASVSRSDGNLGISALLDLPPAVTGCCSAGTAATPTEVSTPADLVSAFGRGPAVSLAALLLKRCGGPIVFCRAATVTAGFAGGIAQSGAGAASPGTLAAGGGNTSSAVPALTGTPDKPYAVRVVITKAGANIAAAPTVKISLDGGVTFLADDSIHVSATPQAIGSTGLLIAWTDGTFVLADLWNAFGVNCATSADSTGSSVPVVSGTPLDAFDIAVKVIRAGASLGALTATVKLSLNGGEIYGPELAVPSNGAVVLGDTGLTLTFGAGTLQAGDVFAFRTAPPLFDTTSLTAALTALEGTVYDHEVVYVAGESGSAEATLVRTSLSTLADAGVYRWGMVEARDQATGETVSAWISSISGATPGFTAFTSDRMAIGAGAAKLLDPIWGVNLRRPVARAVFARLVSLWNLDDNIGIAEHPGMVERGALTDIPEAGLYHDLRLYPSIDQKRFIGAQTIAGRLTEGYFATDRTAAADGSDYSSIMNLRVITQVERGALVALSGYVNKNLRTITGGKIDPRDAAAADTVLTARTAQSLQLANGNSLVNSLTVQVNRTDNIVSTGRLRANFSARPYGYAREVQGTVGFTLR